MSLTNVFDLDGKRAGGSRVHDPQRMRVEFAGIWASYLLANYGRAELVATVFGVTYQTACNWLSGVSRPTGDKVLLEAAAHPARLLEHARDAMGSAA